MTRMTTLRPALLGRVSQTTALFAVCLLASGAGIAQATPLDFTVINVSSGNQSRINIAATADLAGTMLTGNPQFAPGGLNGDGSASTLYNQTGSNTPSNIVANVHTNSIVFPGGGTAMAANASGFFGSLGIAPGVGGTTGTAPADYGLIFTSAQNIVIPPIDVSSLNIPGITTLNLGTLTGINLNVALRNFTLDANSGTIPLSPNNTYPTQFDASQVDLVAAGTVDMSLTATLSQNSLTDWLATGAALIALNSALSGQGINITETGSLATLSYQVGIGYTTALPATNLPNTGAGPGTIDHVGGNLRMTLPVNFDLQSALPSSLSSLLTADFSMSGQLIGQTPYVTVDVPEPSSVLLGLMGIGAFGLMVLRRKRAA